jgi:LPS export ABC transporter protein LptC
MSITRSKIKLLAIVVGLSAIAAVAVVFYRFKGLNDSPFMVLPEAATNTILASTRVRHTATQNGKIQWELEADSAQMKSESQDVILQSPDVVFFSDDGGKIELTAAHGILNTKTNNLMVEGAVRLFNQQFAMHTEKLVYRHAKRILVSEGAIKILGSAVQLQANAMTYNIETNQAHFTGQVEGNIVVETGI